MTFKSFKKRPAAGHKEFDHSLSPLPHTKKRVTSSNKRRYTQKRQEKLYEQTPKVGRSVKNAPPPLFYPYDKSRAKYKNSAKNSHGCHHPRKNKARAHIFKKLGLIKQIRF